MRRLIAARRWRRSTLRDIIGAYHETVTAVLTRSGGFVAK
jgi:hypothetical protein